MKKRIAGAALKYAGKGMAKGFKKKAGTAKAKAARIAKRLEKLVAHALENPGYDPSGASFDLFGGTSRPIPKKAREFSRPRVKIRGKTVTFAKHSPFKGSVERANPSVQIFVAPLRVILSADEVRTLDKDKFPPASLSRKIMAEASKLRGWDHVEAVDKQGRHLFDLAP